MVRIVLDVILTLAPFMILSASLSQNNLVHNGFVGSID